MVFSGSLAHPLNSQPPVPVPSRFQALWRASGTFQSSHDPRGCRGAGGGGGMLSLSSTEDLPRFLLNPW